MSCKLPECYPVSFDNNVENFFNTCPAGYIAFNSPNADCQNVHDGTNPKTYYILKNSTDGKLSLPDPSTGKSAVGWNVIANGGGGPKTSSIATHSVAPGAVGYGGQPNCGGSIQTPHQVTFVDDDKVAGTASYGNNGMSYCILPAPTAPTNLNIISTDANTFTAAWTSGSGHTSYTFSLNGNTIRPSTDRSMTSNSATFTNIPPNSDYKFIVNAVNISGSTSSEPSSSFSITGTLPPTNPPMDRASTSLGDTSLVASANSITTPPASKAPDSSMMLYAGIGGVILIIIIGMFMMGGK